MSRVSSKSGLSPSATRGSNAIDLGKDSGVDMGRKSQPSVSTGGIGVTREVANIGGISVTGGVNVDVSPVRLDISGSPNYEDPSKSSISIGAGAEIPGGILGVSGGVTINTSTGQIEGGSIGGEVAGIGVNISKSSEGVGIGISLQIPFSPISIELGFEFPDEKEENKPTPIPTPTPTPVPGGAGIDLPDTDETGWVIFNMETRYYEWAYINPLRNTNITTREIFDVQEKDRSIDTLPFKLVSTNSIIKRNDYTIAKGTRIHNYQYYQTGEGLETRTIFASQPYPPYTYFFWYVGGFFGSAKRIKEFIALNTKNNDAEIEIDKQRITGQTIVYYYIPTAFIPLIPNQLPPPAFPLPPNPPPRKEMDECCRDSIKLLREIHKRLGVNKFPGQLPSTIIQTVEKGQQPAEPVQEKIEDFSDLLMWIFQRDDERWGQWQIQIDVKDSDLTKEGNQEKQIKFPNLAESIAEMEGQILSLQANVEALVAMSTRNLCESGMARQEAIKAYLVSMAIAKYMNFPYKETDIEIPSTFTPKAESIDELIKESTIHAKGIEYEEKETQRDILLDLLQAAAITRAVHWRQVDPKKDIKSQILESIKGSADLSEKLENPLAKDDDPSKPKHVKDWEDFLDQVEDGFGFETGIENAQTPYGRSRDRRPRIRQIGDNIAQAGKENG